jgi:hypothetical protein
MSAQAFLRETSEFFEALAEAGHLLTWNSHKLTKQSNTVSRVTFASESPDRSPVCGAEASFSDYLRNLRHRQFSAVLNDGSLIQLSCTFDRSDIIAHRFGYLPCPISFDLAELNNDCDEFTELEDFLLLLSDEELTDRLKIRPVLRFEYDPKHLDDNHPASHLHIGKSHCRIPVSAPVSFGHFVRFLFRNFYPTIFQSTNLWGDGPPNPLTRTLVREEHREMHVAM